MKYVNKGTKTLDEMLEEMRANDLANRKRVSDMIRREEEERCERLGCFLTADGMIDFVLEGGVIAANYDTSDYMYYNEERDEVVHHGYDYDDGSGVTYRAVKVKSVQEFKDWAYLCEQYNLQREQPDKYFNPYWNPVENVLPADMGKEEKFIFVSKLKSRKQ